jgi:hypothetical protein
MSMRWASPGPDVIRATGWRRWHDWLVVAGAVVWAAMLRVNERRAEKFVLKARVQAVLLAQENATDPRQVPESARQSPEPNLALDACYIEDATWFDDSAERSADG